MLGAKDDNNLSRSTHTISRLVREEIAQLIDEGIWQARLQVEPEKVPEAKNLGIGSLIALPFRFS